MDKKFTFTMKRLNELPIPNEKNLYYYDEVQPGLRLLVTLTGNKSFQFQQRSKKLGKPLTRTIGKLKSTSLDVARKEAAKLLAELNEGVDIEKEIKESRRARLLEPTVLDFSKIFIERHCEAKQLRSKQEIQRILNKYILPVIDKLKMNEVKKADIIDLLDKIQDRGTLTMCNRTHSVLSQLFNFAVERDVIEISPVSRIKKRGIETKRDRVLSNEELKLLWDSLGNSTTSMLLKFLLLTGQRTGEARLAKWSDIENGNWLIPGENTKNKTAHKVPLSTGATAIIERMKTTSHGQYVFPGRATIASKQDSCLDKDAPNHHLQRVISKFDWERTTVHDLRRTMRSKLSELGITPMISEKILNHTIPGIMSVYDHYDYQEEMSKALQKWSDYLEDIIK